MATFRKLFEIDYRALGVFRIGVGLMLIVDLVGRAFDLTAFYTDMGVLPRAQLVAPVWVDGMFSFHTWGGGSVYEGFLFLLAFLLALLVVLGWRTRWVIFLSWIFLVSLHNRNVIILNGGDHLLRASSSGRCSFRWAGGSRWMRCEPGLPQRRPAIVLPRRLFCSCRWWCCTRSPV